MTGRYKEKQHRVGAQVVTTILTCVDFANEFSTAFSGGKDELQMRLALGLAVIGRLGGKQVGKFSFEEIESQWVTTVIECGYGCFVTKPSFLIFGVLRRS